jgi:hypothetical protein
MPYTGSCIIEDCKSKKFVQKVSNYIFERYQIVLCKKHLKEFRKKSQEEKNLLAKKAPKYYPRFSVK